MLILPPQEQQSMQQEKQNNNIQLLSSNNHPMDILPIEDPITSINCHQSQKTDAQVVRNNAIKEQANLESCNLCKGKQHKTSNCDKARVFYHATNKTNLDSILKQGFIPKCARLGKALYVSDNSIMCIKFVYKNRERFPEPIILKDNHIRNINRPNQIRSITPAQFNQGKIQAVRCPYFKTLDTIYYEYALYKVDYAVVSWSNIKFPQPKKADQMQQEEQKSKQQTQNNVTKSMNSKGIKKSDQRKSKAQKGRA